MSKSKSNHQHSNRTVFVVAAVIVLAVVAGVFVLSRPTTSAPKKITPVQYQAQFANAAHLLIDVRTPDEFASGHIAGAINIPVQTLPDRLAEVPRDKPVVVYCHSGNRSAQAASLLSNGGYTQIYELQGGITAWTAAGFPTIE